MSIELSLERLFPSSELNSIDARKLHKALEVQARFSKWIDNYLKDFKKDNDFRCHPRVRSDNGQVSVEYF